MLAVGNGNLNVKIFLIELAKFMSAVVYLQQGMDPPKHITPSCHSES